MTALQLLKEVNPYAMKMKFPGIELYATVRKNGDQRNATRIVIAREERFVTMESVRKNASMTKIVDQMT